jgi:thiol-disulfide isomerase/thioredoxin
MGKASRTKRLSAREKVAIQREAARRAQRRNQLFITGGSILAVVVIVVGMIVWKTLASSSPSSSSNSSGPTGTALPASVSHQITSVPASTLDSIGLGTTLKYTPSALAGGSGAALTSQGKPEMLYIGAEFCPYCAAMRWSMAVALSRFGTLSTPLRGIHSSATDVDANTPTLTFYKTTYSSKYLAFTPVENETVNKTPLQATTTAQNQVWAKYEPDPNTRGYPFIAFSNKYILKGPLFDPAVLSGKSWSQVAAALHDPSSPIAQGALGGANLITAAICKMTNAQPASVCTSKAVTSVQGHL